MRIEPIYNYAQNSDQPFNEFTKSKMNLLVIGKTEFGQIFGGFTSQGFGS